MAIYGSYNDLTSKRWHLVSPWLWYLLGHAGPDARKARRQRRPSGDQAGCQPFRQLIENEISGAPVEDATGRLVGVVSLTDIAAVASGEGRRLARDGSSFFIQDWGDGWDEEEMGALPLDNDGLLVADIMNPEIYSVREDATVSQIATMMLQPNGVPAVSRRLSCHAERHSHPARRLASLAKRHKTPATGHSPPPLGVSVPPGCVSARDGDIPLRSAWDGAPSTRQQALLQLLATSYRPGCRRRRRRHTTRYSATASHLRTGS
jgi:CBS domain-containing protein